MKARIAKDPREWNDIVEKSPFSVIRHRYEFSGCEKNALPLIIEEKNNRFLFPLVIWNVLGFRVASSPIYYHASLLPSDYESLNLTHEALETTTDFLRGYGVHLLVTSVPTFSSKVYCRLLESYFRTKGAGCSYFYAHMIKTKQKTFEDVWRKDFSKHGRNMVRKAEKQGVRVRPIEEIANYIDVMVSCNVSSLKRQGRLSIYPHCDGAAFLRYLSEHIKASGNHFRIYGAFYNERLIAYMTTMEFNKLVMVTVAFSSSQHLSKAPNNALLAYIIRLACERNFDWVYYALDRVSARASKRSLVSSIRDFKFEHGFREVPIPIYRLGVTKSGRLLSRSMYLPSYAFIFSASFPEPMKRILQHFYDNFVRSENSRFHFLFHD